eukprot:scaffold26349_cov47-Prasinocladus_malaysianus.AAC.1
MVDFLAVFLATVICGKALGICPELILLHAGLPYVLGVNQLESVGGGSVAGDLGIGVAIGSPDILIAGQVTGMAPSSEGFVAIFSGSSCTDIQSHLVSPINGADPWGDSLVLFTANDEGVGELFFPLSGFPIGSLLGKPVVISDANNSPVACGVIESDPEHPPVALEVVDIAAVDLKTDQNGLTTLQIVSK